MHKEEKKVEYLELVYDLIFVYIIGRNNSLLHNIENGFVSGQVFLAYVLCSLAVIQIWNYSTFYTNLHGENSVRDHRFMFLNMYLLYYIGEGVRVHWESFQLQFHMAWALILINIGVQYLLEQKHHRGDAEEEKAVKSMSAVLFAQAAIVLLAIPVYNHTGISIEGAAILFGIVATWVLSGKHKALTVDFAHLTERAMLYVVFTFGEMIIAVASYFKGGLTVSSFYFFTMSFLIVVGLFLCYELLYDHIIDRQMKTSGLSYIMIHIFLVFGLNIITTSLEFMRDIEVNLWSKLLLLMGAFLLFFICLFLLLGYAKPEMKRCTRFVVRSAVISVVFVGVMILLRENMYLNVLITVLYVLAQLLMLNNFRRQKENIMIANIENNNKR
ncbi:MAG: low temperature requirement protein A [Oscillospiraceae bacterium]|nr:low temperature requirement protein A [Oscillospiraceae bacterium]